MYEREKVFATFILLLFSTVNYSLSDPVWSSTCVKYIGSLRVKALTVYMLFHLIL